MDQPSQDVQQRRDVEGGGRFAGRRRDHLTVQPVEQAGAEPVLDVSQLMAERRLRQIEDVAGASQAGVLRERDDEAQVSDVEVHVRLPTRHCATSRLRRGRVAT